MDPHRLKQRQKQVDMGLNTPGYQHYLESVPRSKRCGYKEHPRTPDIREQISKRCFDGRIKAWRRALHLWDPAVQEGQQVINEAPPPRASHSEPAPNSQAAAEPAEPAGEPGEPRGDPGDVEPDPSQLTAASLGGTGAGASALLLQRSIFDDDDDLL